MVVGTGQIPKNNKNQAHFLNLLLHNYHLYEMEVEVEVEVEIVLPSAEPYHH
jgi:hypothetical protein